MACRRSRPLVAGSEEEAVSHAGRIGYPVVLKLHSETITHKTDVGGVQLNLGDGEAVARAYRRYRRRSPKRRAPSIFRA